jgi:uncharacterized protein with LGFP repeats
MTSMKRIALALALAALAGPAAAADKTYQVTGPVVEVKPESIVVQKDKEKWEIAKGDVKTEVKKGDNVTVKYKMTATSIEVKPAKKK